jgi:iron complex outermembrane receptor protein
MKFYIATTLLFLFSTLAFSQYSLEVRVLDAETGEPLPGAAVRRLPGSTGAVTNASGQTTLENIAGGLQLFQASYLGYQLQTDTLNFPYTGAQPYIFRLNPAQHDEHLEEVVVTTTRSSRTIDDEPTRIEAITAEEIGEKANMKPGDIRMLLSESTGIQTQQISATSASAVIRIQGLDGRYTQLLQDGFPLYAGFSGGLSIMQIPPLNLSQVEIIKGSSSTLYGGGAIAGLVNLITKQPTEEGELSAMLNLTTAGGLDASTFYGKKWNKLGLSVFAARNSNQAYDPADIGLSAIPEFTRYTLNPRLYVYPGERTQLYAGLNTTYEDRLGGDLRYIAGEAGNFYFERNESRRYSTQFHLEHELSNRRRVVARNSVSFFDRLIQLPDYRFSGQQIASFSELTYSNKGQIADWVAGLNLWTDQFNEQITAGSPTLDYGSTIIGGFTQATVNLSPATTLEAGLRTDYISPKNHRVDKQLFVLPRLSVLFEWNEKLSSRLGGGLGYKTPTLFTQEAEQISFRQVLPLTTRNLSAEESVGLNADVNYATPLGEHATFSLNQLFFYTRINNPLVLNLLETGQYQFATTADHFDTHGLETNAKFTYHWAKLFLGYTYTNVQRHAAEGERTALPLVPRHRLNTVLMLEKEDNFRIGLEAYYFGEQPLSNGTTGRSYWITGIMAEKVFERFSLFLNFENLLDTRQSRFGSIYTGSLSQPQFNEIFAPVDGRVINGGFKLNIL